MNYRNIFKSQIGHISAISVFEEKTAGEWIIYTKIYPVNINYTSWRVLSRDNY